jgi:D-beta-D-heptose 7-phosphate kinase/D-beta-D-heptose 1-phosphate adenosyltransferase
MNKILVVGDVMLDIYMYGQVDRISPEAPIPVVLIEKETHQLGGAANVAHNIVSLEAECVLWGLMGTDYHSQKLDELLLQKKIENCIVKSADFTTTTKCRVVAMRQQITRMDFEKKMHLNSSLIEGFFKSLKNQWNDLGVIVLSDYAKGALSEELCQRLILNCREMGKKVLVDPKSKNWNIYRGASLIAPNFKEFLDVISDDISHLSDEEILSQYGPKILEQYELGALLVTRSQNGMTLITRDVKTLEIAKIHFEAEALEVFDVSGAGDTVLATLAVYLNEDKSLLEAISLANTAAAIAVSKAGTATVTREEIAVVKKKRNYEKFIDLEHLSVRVEDAKKKGQKVVFTNGCFDLMHRGHIEYLREARACGDVLIVGLNSDRSVKALKGESRPINQEVDRAFMLSQFPFVDHVIVFDEETPLDLIRQIRPDILVKGGDYTPDQIVGREYAQEVRALTLVNGYSTTRILEKSSSK